MKYIVVTGGVISGLGKGVTIASIGRILLSSNLNVTSVKIDPYVNIDAGTMSPLEHGETFVLNDGAETDLDLGNYERFLDITLTAKHNITTGKVFQEVIRRERQGAYLGKTVQLVPHCTDLIQSWIEDVARIPVTGTDVEPDVCLIEVGGTVGDIESMVFLEALRQFQFTIGRNNIMFIHVSLVPFIDEQKSKPTQHSVKELRAIGLSPDVIICRSTDSLSSSLKNKISGFCQVPPHCVISAYDCNNLLEVPIILADQDLHSIIRKQLELSDIMTEIPNLSDWASLSRSVNEATEVITIAIVGKYTSLPDAYKSVIESLRHSAYYFHLKLEIQWIDSSHLETECQSNHPKNYNSAGTKTGASGSQLK